ncbi:hypothetical protein [Mesorhizobium sp. ES1-1]|uniref:hypothetical protein n=1 Tax=Mesorhizobium sp. ES1-1 TaxID=2876629 RepID=UPI001CCDBADC|nr:hypothetical protein [Mesorhizobium sp. ES1-1]MBZ9676417.1 hypothetical protein [Mesorhizobium sp. ES1-1]
MNHYPIELRDDLNHTLVKAIHDFGIINVPVLAAQVAARHRDLCASDAERLILGFAELYNAPLEFDRTGCDWHSRPPVGGGNKGLLLEIVQNEFSRAA